jgi:multidrug efflux pump subunit AcrA (membrane-fusion protein)
LIVPRSAVLPNDGRYILFTVEKGRAKEHTVRVGLQNKNEVEVSMSTDLPSDAPVVTLGNYQLKDGMSVKVDEAR